MPMVRIDIIERDDEATTTKRLRGLGDAVFQAMTETIDVPEGDRFQILQSHKPGRISYDPAYPGIERDDDFVLISVTLRAGRTDAQKAAFYRRTAELAHELTGAEPRDVMIALTENHPADWSFGEGIGQYIS